MSESGSIQPSKKPKPLQPQQPQPLQPQQTDKKDFKSVHKPGTMGAMFSFMGKNEKIAMQEALRLANITIMAQMNHYLQRMKEINQEESS